MTVTVLILIKCKITFNQKHFCDIGETDVEIELRNEYRPILSNKHKNKMYTHIITKREYVEFFM